MHIFHGSILSMFLSEILQIYAMQIRIPKMLKLGPKHIFGVVLIDNERAGLGGGVGGAVGG